MSNIVHEDKMYNEEIKREYMSRFKKGTQRILERIFKITCRSEEELNKDLHQFSREELRRTFYLFMASTPNASRANVQYIQGYISYCLDEGYVTGLNPLDNTDMKWKEQFVIQQQRSFWRYDELDNMLNKLVNAQDQAIIALLREGVRGQEGGEIVNLKRKDIDFEAGILTLTDADGSQRKLKVTDKCLAICERAIREDEYMKKNGNASLDIKSESADLLDTDYVIRSAHTRNTNFDQADHHIIYRRLSTIANEFDEPNMSPQSVFYSGMLAMAHDLLQQDRLNASGYKEIAERYNVSDAVMQRLKGDFLNEDFISELYGKS